jgi:uncharacterized protein (DUF433 family)
MEALSDRISADPAIMRGKPCIKGTRITVEHVLRELSTGMSAAEVVDAYPHLSLDDVHAALAYAADHVGKEKVAAAAE